LLWGSFPMAYAMGYGSFAAPRLVDADPTPLPLGEGVFQQTARAKTIRLAHPGLS
jgi:hypothetical protein